MNEPNDEQYGGALRTQLRRTMPTSVGVDLVGPSVRRARGVRRRRRVLAVAGGVAAAVVIPAVVFAGGPWSTQTPAPVATTAVPGPVPTAVTGPTPRATSAKPPSLVKTINNPSDLADLDRGDPPMVETVQNGVWHRSDGSTVRLDMSGGGGDVATFLSYHGGLFAALEDTTGRTTVTVYGTQGQAKAMPSIRGTLFQHGPDGSIVWTNRQGAGPGEDNIILLDAERVQHRFQLPSDPSEAPFFVAAGDYIFVNRGEQVIRYPISTTGLGRPSTVPGFDAVDVLETSTGAHVVLQKNGCRSYVDATTLKTVFRSCSSGQMWWSSQSPDGRYLLAVVAGSSDRQAAVLDATTGKVLVTLRGFTAEAGFFDTRSRLNHLGRQTGSGQLKVAVVVTDLVSGQSHRATVTAAREPDGIGPYSFVR